ncbi:Sodium/calcium exchanger protein-domain-containing protein [Hysterangium stoloniferum]|nr:Sodium/calcium exchanger protein-domain-containing protein [Hysterangium stoloniferum]
MPSERSPLLDSGNGHQNASERSFGGRVVAFMKGEGEPGFPASYYYFFFSSWFNLFLIFVPLSGLSHYLKWDAGLRFVFSFLAIIPLAKLIGQATEEMSYTLGDTLSGLLNASFGNAVEIIVGIAALLQNQVRIVQTSMLGSILGNILLVLGSSFIAGGFRDLESNFQVTAAQTSASLMTLGCITLVIPAAYRSSKLPSNSSSSDPLNKLLSSAGISDEADAGLLTISRGTAIVLLIVYASYMCFQLKTHAHLFHPRNEPESTGAESEERGPSMSTFAAATALLLVTVITSFCADWLVSSIEETADRYHISKAFIGLILIPIVANAAEHTTSIWMALRGRYELTIGICVGSSIQIALFVVPLLVLVGWISGHELTLFFADFETIVLFMSVVLVDLLIMDGKSNYMEGLMLVALYFVIALAFWVS